MKTFVITGATGFIGGALASHLIRDNNNVIVLCRDGDPPKGCEVVRGELEDLRTCERLINEHRPDGVFHLAAQAMVGHAKRDPFATLEANVRGTYNLLEAFRRHHKPDARLVIASSDKAYGELPAGSTAYDEDMPLEGRGPYDCSKSCADLIAHSYGITYSLPIAIVRAGNVYGPGDRDLSRIIPSLIDDILKWRPLTIRSDGTPIRDYVYVGDVVKGYIAAYNMHTSPTARAFNLAGDNSMTVLQVAELMLEVINSVIGRANIGTVVWRIEDYLKRTGGSIVVLGERSGEIQRQVLDSSRALTELGWKAKADMRSCLVETLKWGYEYAQ